jgi:tRNA 2-selenouridine synthase
MMNRRILPHEFLELTGSLPLVDTRSPSEYGAGHIPGAVSLPLFTDAERDVVGKTYKAKGRREAVIEGLKAVGPALPDKLKTAIGLAPGGELLVYCWRGGMRSDSMAWLFALGDLTPILLEGGYKAYRNWILDYLAIRRNSLILGGMTGSGKTEILSLLKAMGEQIIDLEGIASHRGSAFGSLGQGRQPTTEHFANLLYEEWSKLDHNKVVWLEDESRSIGSVFLPEIFWKNMQESPVIAIISDIKTRVPRLVKDYSQFPPEHLIASVERISKRLGGDRTADAIKAIETRDFAKAAEITLAYYDKAYLHALNQRNPMMLHIVKSDTGDAEQNALKVFDFALTKGLLSLV